MDSSFHSAEEIAYELIWRFCWHPLIQARHPYGSLVFERVMNGAKPPGKSYKLSMTSNNLEVFLWGVAYIHVPDYGGDIWEDLISNFKVEKYLGYKFTVISVWEKVNSQNHCLVCMDFQWPILPVQHSGGVVVSTSTLQHLCIEYCIFMWFMYWRYFFIHCQFILQSAAWTEFIYSAGWWQVNEWKFTLAWGCDGISWSTGKGRDNSLYLQRCLESLYIFKYVLIV